VAIRRGTCQFELFSNTIIRLGRKTSQAWSAAFDAALSKLGLIDRTDPATLAIAKLIIELAKEGERDPERLCALALKHIKIRPCLSHRSATLLP
jgi:hypothetical protein